MENQQLDAYAKALQTQNNGGVCEHCTSALGHYSTCPLINREVAQIRSRAAGVFTEEDRIIAHGLGVQL